MHRITLILILFLLLPDMYIYLVYIVKENTQCNPSQYILASLLLYW